MPEATKEAHNATVAETNNKKLEFIEEVTKNAHQIQKRVLQEILFKNASVEYLKRHGLKGCTEREKFKKIMPVVTYEDILRDINRIAAGDASPILCADPISEFLTSSGTSGGERKMMPTIEEELDRRSMLYSLLMPVMSQFIEGLDQGKGMYFLFIKSETRTPAGLPARPVLTSYYKSPHFKNRPFDPYTNYTSPNEAILCPDSYQSMYSQILCGLAQNRHVIRLGAVFASGFIRAIRFLEKNWALLCHDIKTGTVNELVTDPFVREAVSRVVTPDPELAEFVESECRRDDRRGIIVRVWPNAKYIDVIVTGAMAQYIPTLDYYGGGLPLVSTMYASSECYFGINLNPLCNPSDVAYTLIPTMCYYEFLPIEKNNRKEQPKLGELGQDLGELVDLVDVKLGHEYELIVTTYAGLYRYRVGDVLRVAGFKNSAPQFNFVCRKNVVLSIDTDKTDEVELHTAVTNAARNLTPFDAALTEYTSYADTAAIPGHYVLYWEVSRNECAPIPPAVLEECCLAVEESLGSVYRQNRVCEAIGALEIRVVENGTFDKVMDYAISEGGSINQYKTPRCVKFAPIVELLDSKVAAAYYSRDCPKWTTPALNHWTCTK